MDSGQCLRAVFVPAHKPSGCRRADTDRRARVSPPPSSREGVVVPIDELES